MTLKSMTGFARADGAIGPTRWHWEVRSVNGRGLDLRLKLPSGYESLEPLVREAAAKRLKRGNVAIMLSVKREESIAQVRLNPELLQQVLAAAEQVRAAVGGSNISVDGLLSVKGVLDVVEAEESEEEVEARTQAMMASLEEALAGIEAMRASEGARLRLVLLDLLHEIERCVEAAAASPARSPEVIRARLKEQVARLLETSSAFDETRLHQEAVLLATRADIEEELQRLRAHIAAAREMLDTTEPVGRRLDFLSQEFNREANTLCSKANDREITRLGLELKALIEQMREQIQNIE
ncbi:MAG: YicC family protein [Proteobacteria bacterium]|jgi:TIGR00255 family protein|nr:MAG: YicC family protein [Pseudomonadota bacterium]